MDRWKKGKQEPPVQDVTSSLRTAWTNAGTDRFHARMGPIFRSRVRYFSLGYLQGCFRSQAKQSGLCLGHPVRALGIVPGIGTLYSRFHVPESPRYAEKVLRDAELTEIGEAYALGITPTDSEPSDTSVERPFQSWTSPCK